MANNSSNVSQNHKRRAAQQAAALMKAMGVSPIRYLIERFAEAEAGVAKDEMAFKLVEYECPKLRAVDVELAGQQSVTVVIGGAPQPNEVSGE